MAFAETGKLHSEINAYNLLLIDPNTYCHKPNLKNAPRVQVNPMKWGYDVPVDGCRVPESDLPVSTSTSTFPQLEGIAELDRGPACVIHDIEFTLSKDQRKDELHSDRTGIPAFMSIQLLESYICNAAASRCFIHDAESLLWVLIWTVAHCSVSQERWEITPAAERFIRQLSKLDVAALCEHKRGMISDGPRLAKKIRELKTDFAIALSPVIGQLADFFFIYLYSAPDTLPLFSSSSSFKDIPQSSSNRSSISDMEKIILEESYQELSRAHQGRYNLHKQYIKESRSQTFSRIFDIIRKQILVLEQWYRLPAL
ncbi:hypothetical protein RhiJN_20156 [Ceratobasidium sp. AG-Ba]|nr:hypothetical protein RhiJN_20156 [Ceratobasidium sp. AG-Ba]